MRCSNCGWPNDEGATRCVKCNSELRAQDSLEQCATISESTGEGRYFSDEQHCQVCGYPVTSDMTRCPACNSPLQEAAPATDGDSETITLPPPLPQPDASAPLQPAQPLPSDGLDEEDVVATIPGLPETYMRGVDVTGTVNPWADPMGIPAAAEPAFRLEKVAWRQEQPSPALEFRGEQAILSRDNTDPDNNSITSQGQARIFRKGDGWMIENLSRQQTTLIRVDRETPLQDGDVIVLGNRMFVFHT